MARFEPSIAHKKERLFKEIGKHESLAVGFSGGVDSTLLLSAAKEVLGDRVIAMTAKSPTHPQRELDHAAEMAAQLGVRHVIFETDEMEDAQFTANGSERCYHCKIRLFRAMRLVADEMGVETMAHGANKDDLSDHRPGFRAAEELGVAAPLLQAGLTKSDIRHLAKAMGLSSWNRPSMACLATRIPYGVEINADVLKKVEQAEAAVRRSGVSTFRVRHHGNIARIEIDMAQMGILSDIKTRENLVQEMRALGYKFVCLDLEGYITGKMNREL